MSSPRSSDPEGLAPEYRPAPVEGWPPAALAAVATGAQDLRTRLIMDLVSAVIGVLALYWGLSAKHSGTGSKTFVVIVGVLLILPLLNLGRRDLTGFRGQVRYYRFGPGWAGRGQDRPAADGGSERAVRTDQLTGLVIGANLFGRYFVDLTDGDGRKLRLTADDLRRPEYWRAVADGAEASIGHGTLDAEGARMNRCLTWLNGRADGAQMPPDYRKPGRS